MKKLLLAICLLGLAAACKSSGASMHDSSCTGKDCADCAAMKADDCKNCTAEQMADCQKCQAEQTCPVTGKKMN